MSYKSGQAGKSTRGMAKKCRQSAVWIGVIGTAFVIVLWILLQNSKALEIGGIGILLLLVLMRVIAFVPPTQPVKGVNIMNKKYLLEFLQRTSRPNAVNEQIWLQRDNIADRLKED